MNAHPFSLLYQLAGDTEQADIFSADSSIESWLAAERALALAQADLGVIDPADAAAIVAAARLDNIDRDDLWVTAKNVGYPILGLVRQVSAHLPDGPNGRVHYGATTQDIMDLGLVLQLGRSLRAIDAGLARFGDVVAARVEEHAATIMPGRTHAQQAVPTTLGATLATLLEQVRRQRERVAQALDRLEVVSLFGAGGTNAAEGPQSVAIRAGVARRLGLRTVDVPWHVDRDVLAEYGWLCASICATLAKLARNIVDLSRTEVGEVFEPYNPHRGASSTMPQKVNPISSELLIGISTTTGALASALPRIQESGHERAAGEWQAEWVVFPQLGVLTGSALAEALVIVEGLRVDAERMRENLRLDGGLIMAEAQMIQLAGAMGREHAHDLLYEAATRARSSRRILRDVLPEVAAEHGLVHLLPERLVAPEDYLGEAQHIAAVAVAAWQRTPGADAAPAPVAELATAYAPAADARSGAAAPQVVTA